MQAHKESRLARMYIDEITNALSVTKYSPRDLLSSLIYIVHPNVPVPWQMGNANLLGWMCSRESSHGVGTISRSSMRLHEDWSGFALFYGFVAILKVRASFVLARFNNCHSLCHSLECGWDRDVVGSSIGIMLRVVARQTPEVHAAWRQRHSVQDPCHLQTGPGLMHNNRAHPHGPRPERRHSTAAQCRVALGFYGACVGVPQCGWPPLPPLSLLPPP